MVYSGSLFGINSIFQTVSSKARKNDEKKTDEDLQTCILSTSSNMAYNS